MGARYLSIAKIAPDSNAPNKLVSTRRGWFKKVSGNYTLTLRISNYGLEEPFTLKRVMRNRMARLEKTFEKL